MRHVHSKGRSSTLVLFDIDGTLLRGAGHHHKQALIDGIRTVTGFSTDFDGLSTSGMLDRDLITAMLKSVDRSDEEIREVMHRIVDECQNAYDANCPSGLARFLCPGVDRLLAELRARGAVLGLVTGNLSRIAHRKMALAGIDGYFAVGAFAEDAGTRTALARVAAERALEAGLIAPGFRASLIGDHLNDIAAAKGNGFRSIAVATGLIPLYQLQAAEPDILVHTLEELDVAKLF
jgi:phosphoglycolate phosphatase